MTLLEKMRILAEDFGLEQVIYDNDLTDEEVLTLLYNQGLIDMDLYQLVDEDEEDD